MPVLRAQAQARRGLDLELRRAFAENEFELYFQPQIRLLDDAVVGAEALLRWRHPERGVLAPGAFIDTLGEQLDRARGRPLDHPHRLRADRGLARHGAAARAHRRQSVSRASCHDEALLKDVEDALRDTGLPAEALELEITENVALNFEDAIGAAEAARAGRQARLRRFRHRLCLAELSDALPALAHQDRPQLRAARSPTMPSDAAIVRSLIAMAHNLGLEVIAEGVETEAQAAFLLKEHCEEAQGFLYAKPLPAGRVRGLSDHPPACRRNAGRREAVGSQVRPRRRQARRPPPPVGQVIRSAIPSRRGGTLSDSGRGRRPP